MTDQEEAEKEFVAKIQKDAASIASVLSLTGQVYVNSGNGTAPTLQSMSGRNNVYSPSFQRLIRIAQSNIPPAEVIYVFASTIEEAKHVLINHANMPDFYLMEDECLEETLKAGIHRDIRIRWIRYVEDLYGLAYNPDKNVICYSPQNEYLTELATAFKSTHNITFTSMSFLRSNMEDFKKSDDPVLQEIAKAIEKEIGVDRQNIPPVEWTT